MLGGVVSNKVHWRKAGLQGDNGFSATELQRQLTSYRRYNVHLSLLGFIIDDHQPENRSRFSGTQQAGALTVDAGLTGSGAQPRGRGAGVDGA